MQMRLTQRKFNVKEIHYLSELLELLETGLYDEINEEVKSNTYKNFRERVKNIKRSYKLTNEK